MSGSVAERHLRSGNPLEEPLKNTKLEMQSLSSQRREGHKAGKAIQAVLGKARRGEVGKIMQARQNKVRQDIARQRKKR